MPTRTRTNARKYAEFIAARNASIAVMRLAGATNAEIADAHRMTPEALKSVIQVNKLTLPPEIAKQRQAARSASEHANSCQRGPCLRCRNKFLGHRVQFICKPCTDANRDVLA